VYHLFIRFVRSGDQHCPTTDIQQPFTARIQLIASSQPAGFDRVGGDQQDLRQQFFN
jgi:hypothetical protein